jgi:hypothetical protein
MAINILGAVQVPFDNSTTPAPETVTVPSGCTAAIVLWEGWTNGTEHKVSSITLNGVAPDFSLGDYIVTGNNTTDWAGAFLFKNPASGSRDIEIEVDNTIEGGPVCTVIFLEGDDGLGFGDFDFDAQVESNPAGGSIDSIAGDLIIAWHWGYAPGGSGTTAPDAAYTEQVDGYFQDSHGLLLFAISPGAGSTYTLTAEQGSYTLSGQTAGLRRNAVVPAAQGSYAVSGQNVTLTYTPAGGYTITAAQGTYAVTGQAAGLIHGYRLAASQGTYAITGSTALIDFAMAVAQGTYTISGQTVQLSKSSPSVVAGQGTYTVSGQVVGLLYGRRVVAAQGTYTVTGQDAALSRTRVLQVAQGSYTVSGQTVALRIARTLAGAQGAYSVTGQAVLFVSGQRLVADQGTYTITGFDVGLRRTALMPAAQGSYLVTGQDVGARTTRAMLAAQGTYAVTGQDVALRRLFTIAISQGTYAIAGQDVTLHAQQNSITIQTGSYSVTGNNVNLLYSGALFAGTQNFLIQIDRIWYATSGTLFFR